MAGNDNRNGKLYPMSIFRIKAAKAMNVSQGLSDTDLTIILTYLARDKVAIVYDQQVIRYHIQSPRGYNLTIDRTGQDHSFIASLNL